MRKIFLFVVCISILVSCSSKKDILYLQDIENYIPDNFTYKDIVLDYDDIVRIRIYTLDPELSLIFNKTDVDIAANSSLESMKINGYLIDNEGYISFPVIGKIKLSGLTLRESEKLISKLLAENNLLFDATTDVRLLNSNFTVLGEVSSPGTYFFYENNMNILKAISIAGDLTINGKRTDIKLIREIDGQNLVKNIDLTKSNYLSSDFFQIISGDIIIVNPNNSRIKNAGIIGNSGTLISLLSFVLSSIIVISNR